MSNILAINLCNSGSTGKIVAQIGQESRRMGHHYYFGYPERPENKPKDKNDLIIMSYFSFRISRKWDYLFGNTGLLSYFTTKKFLRKIKRLKIDIIHLHNIHGGFINLKLLFRYIKKNNISVVWTLHDCWAFTGRCPHFQISGCEKWKNGCSCCAYPKKMYPPSLVDRTKRVWREKRKLFLGVGKLAIVTPSYWLSKIVGESFLKVYPVFVVNNGIDLSVFKPTPSNFRERINADKKYIVLGVSFGWTNKKGLDVFIGLAKELPQEYVIVLVGTDLETDKELPANIISIHRTHDQKELAEIYSSADLFLNPSREDTYPTVNMESLACGTPVLTFKTGGSPEIIDETCGCVVNSECVFSVLGEVVRICENKPYSKDDCLKRAKNFDLNKNFKEYMKIYNKMTLFFKCD